MPTSLYQATYVVLCMSVTGALFQEKQPTGPIQCREHCRQFTKCTFCVFRVSRLACIATWSRHPLQTRGEETVYLTPNQDEDRSSSPRRMKCPDRYSRIVLTRSSNQQCIKLRSETPTRLLAAQIKLKRMTRFSQKHPTMFAFEDHRYLRGRDVSAIAYVPSLHTVLVASENKKSIQSCPLNRKGCVTVKKRNQVTHMAVDDGEQLVFLATRKPSSSVIRMTPYGRYFKDITGNHHPHALALCLDTTRQILYVGNRRELFSLSYDGEHRKVIQKGFATFALTLDDNHNSLYLGLKRGIKVIRLSVSSRMRQVERLRSTPQNIAFFGERVYISYAEDRYMAVLLQYRHILKVKVQGDHLGHVITQIPWSSGTPSARRAEGPVFVPRLGPTKRR